MQQKYFAGAVQPPGSDWAVEDRELSAKFAQAENELTGYMADLQFHRALESIWSALDHANRYVVQTAPFTLIKDPAKRARVGEVLYHLLEAVRTLARVLAPFMPDTAAELRSLLNLDASALRAPWGEGFSAGHRINPPKVLFPRIETDGKK
jgi:methionyl-tRNA synthetase